MHDGHLYKAEPQSWFSHQVAQNPNDFFSAGFLFWGKFSSLIFEEKMIFLALMVASIIFALIVLFALCFGCVSIFF